MLAYSLGHRGLPLAPAAVVLDTLQAPSLALFPPVILLFPDGRLASRGWRRVLWVYAVLTAYVAVVSVAQGVAAVAGHDIHLGTNGNLTSTGQLGGWLANPPAWLAFPVLASIAAIGLSFVARQALSWRRAGGERRQQLKWLASGAAMTVFSILLGILIGSPVPLVGLAALPAAIGVAILKYRLYDADQTVAAFAARLKDAVDLDSVRDDLTTVVQQALEPAHLSVWISRRT